MRIIPLMLLAALLVCAALPASAMNADQEDVMETILAFKNEIPRKDALKDISIRAKFAYGTPLQSATWRFSDGKFACDVTFGKSLTATSPRKDESGVFQAVTGEAEYPYLVYLPAHYDEQKAYPTLLFLHGIGERGDDPTALCDYGPFQYILAGRRLDMIVISPQLEQEAHWVEDAAEREVDTQMNRLRNFIDQMKTRYAVDGNRLYLTGLSMGGRGAYKLACHMPDAFAAVAVCCGRAGVWNAPDRLFYDVSRIADLPVWIFHGLSDSTVDPDHALAALRELLRVNPRGDFRLTLYPAVGHECYEHAYLDPALYAWLEEQRR